MKYEIKRHVQTLEELIHSVKKINDQNDRENIEWNECHKQDQAEIPIQENLKKSISEEMRFCSYNCLDSFHVHDNSHYWTDQWISAAMFISIVFPHKEYATVTGK